MRKKHMKTPRYVVQREDGQYRTADGWTRYRFLAKRYVTHAEATEAWSYGMSVIHVR